jgi:hypothetical protein
VIIRPGDDARLNGPPRATATRHRSRSRDAHPIVG